MSGRVLVTGATGFVGSHLVEAFLAAGHEVRCGARDPRRPRWLSGLPVEPVPLDLERPDQFSRTLKGVDTVVHAAGITRARRPEAYVRINAVGTRRLADAAQEHRVRRFVQISSLAARGPDGLEHPTGAYGRSKRDAEELLPRTGRHMEIVVLRPTAVYGPRDTDLLPLFELAKKGLLPIPTGPGVLQPVYATDVAGAAVAAAGVPDPGFGPFPVAGRESYSWEQVVRALEKAVGRKIRPVPVPAAVFGLAGRLSETVAKFADKAPDFDVRRARDLAVHTWTCDVSKTETALGWTPETPLSEGLDLTARWYEKNGWL